MGQTVPKTLSLRDSDGTATNLGDCLNGKPAILVLVQFECPMLCTLVLNGLVEGLKEMEDSPSQDFVVLTIGIDPRETAELASRKR